jgi:hypothetical protein
MLSRDPIARPASAADVAEALLAIEEALMIPPPPPPSKLRWWHTTVPAVVLLIVAIGIYSIVRRPKKSELEIAPAAMFAETVLEPRDVLRRVGDRVTVEFTVQSVLRAPDGRVYLTAEQENTEEFRAVLSGETQAGLRSLGFVRAEMLTGARVRIDGKLVRDEGFTILQVAGANQFLKLTPPD